MQSLFSSSLSMAKKVLKKEKPIQVDDSLLRQLHGCHGIPGLAVTPSWLDDIAHGRELSKAILCRLSQEDESESDDESDDESEIAIEDELRMILQHALDMGYQDAFEAIAKHFKSFAHQTLLQFYFDTMTSFTDDKKKYTNSLNVIQREILLTKLCQDIPTLGFTLLQKAVKSEQPTKINKIFTISQRRKLPLSLTPVEQITLWVSAMCGSIPDVTVARVLFENKVGYHKKTTLFSPHVVLLSTLHKDAHAWFSEAEQAQLQQKTLLHTFCDLNIFDEAVSIKSIEKLMRYAVENNKKIVKAKNAAGNHLGHIVVRQENSSIAIAMLKVLCQHGIKLDEKNDALQTPLHLVSSADMAKFLLDESHLSLPEKDFQGLTPLQHAIIKDMEDVALAYLNYSPVQAICYWVRINGAHKLEMSEDNNGFTALHFAAQKFSGEVLKQFLNPSLDSYSIKVRREFSDVNKDIIVKKNKFKQTPFHRAVMFSNYAAIEQLLDYVEVNALKSVGKQFTKKDTNQRHAFHLAANHAKENPLDPKQKAQKLWHILIDLAEKYMKLSLPGKKSWSSSNKPEDYYLLKKDKDGMTPLHLACQRGNGLAVRAILGIFKENRQDFIVEALLGAQDNDGRTIFHHAASLENPEIFQYLQNICRSEHSKLLALSQKDNYDCTPLFYTRQRGKGGGIKLGEPVLPEKKDKQKTELKNYGSTSSTSGMGLT